MPVSPSPCPSAPALAWPLRSSSQFPYFHCCARNSPSLDAPDLYFSIQSSAASQRSAISPTAVFPRTPSNPHQQLASLCSSPSCCSQHPCSQLSQISKMSLLCIAVCPAVIPGCDGWERSLSRPSARTFWWIKEAKSSSHPLHGILSLIKCH